MKNTVIRIGIVLGILVAILGLWMWIDKMILANDISKIELIEKENINTENVTIFEDNVGKEILGEEEYFTSFEIEEVGVSGIIANTSVQLIPNPDFLDTQVYHYYEDGTLALYVSISNTVGGQIKYYFKNGKLIKTVNELDEESISPTLLNENEILAKARAVYDRYLVK